MMMNKFFKHILIIVNLCILSLSSSNLFAQNASDIFLTGSFWTEKAPLVEGLPSAERSTDTMILEILEEARSIFSAMIYGYKFMYVPLDSSRSIQERFTLEPIALVSNSVDTVKSLESNLDNSILQVILSYNTSLEENLYLTSWRSAALPDTSGTGTAAIETSREAKYLAFKQACKEAIRAYGRAISRNKPSRMEGSFALVSIPKFQIVNGQYKASVHLRIKLDDMSAYRTW